MNRISELEKRVEALEAENRRLVAFDDSEVVPPLERRKPGRPRKHEAQEVREG